MEDYGITVEIAPDEYDDGRETIYAGVIIPTYSRIAYVDTSADTIEHALLNLIKQMGEVIADFEAKGK